MRIISMPDKWEYPWYAAWDLAFHCVPLALIVTVPVAVAVLAMPMWGIHRAIVAAKETELERATVAIGAATADSDRRLLWWLYRQEIAQAPEWPVAARSATRIALYVVIPPLAWVGAALVQDAVANVLGLH